MLRRTAFLCLAVLLVCKSVHADVITFTPLLDADNQANTSSATAYDANNNTQANGNAGIVDDGSTSTYSDTFHFLDASSGIQFSFDLIWDGNGDALNPTSLALGVGSNTAINPSESLTITVANLDVDLTGYLAGSIGSITNASLSSASVAFDEVLFTDFDFSTVVQIAGTSTITFGDDDGNFDAGIDGLTVNETSLTFSRDGSSEDTGFNISSTEFRVTMDITQAVPEPGNGVVLLLAAASAMCRNRRRTI